VYQKYDDWSTDLPRTKVTERGLAFVRARAHDREVIGSRRVEPGPFAADRELADVVREVNELRRAHALEQLDETRTSTRALVRTPFRVCVRSKSRRRQGPRSCEAAAR
jgi:hypothetical protein